MLEKKFKNQNIILTGQQSLKVYDVMKMLSEILGIEKRLKNLKIKKTVVTTQEHHIPINQD